MADPVFLFDAECALCSGATRFILRHEATQDLRFLSTRSAEGRRLALAHGLKPEDLETTILVIDAQGRGFTRSAAVLELSRRLKAPWRALGVMARAIPRPIRDAAYDLVARRRYQWFGRAELCALASPEQRHRFMDEGAPLALPTEAA